LAAASGRPDAQSPDGAPWRDGQGLNRSIRRVRTSGSAEGSPSRACRHERSPRTLDTAPGPNRQGPPRRVHMAPPPRPAYASRFARFERSDRAAAESRIAWMRCLRGAGTPVGTDQRSLWQPRPRARLPPVASAWQRARLPEVCAPVPPCELRPRQKTGFGKSGGEQSRDDVQTADRHDANIRERYASGRARPRRATATAPTTGATASTRR
jgi:hypothetical protein